MRILTFAGTRPQLIKAATLSRQLRQLDEIVLAITGRTNEMNLLLSDFIDAPKPDYSLGIESGESSERLAKIIMSAENVIDEADPDLVITIGDTDTTFGASLSSVKSGYPLAHIDAGVRIYDRSLPEEMNRRLTDHISDIFFCSTPSCLDNLSKEGIFRNVFLTGDLMVDALLSTSKISLQKSSILQSIGIEDKKYIVLAIHSMRTIEKLDSAGQIFSAIESAGIKTVFAMDSKIDKALSEAGLSDNVRGNPNLVVTSPMSYTDFIRLIMGSEKILTDSGVIQREAYILKVPCITLRSYTEWPETVQDGWNILVGTDKDKIENAIRTLEPTGMQRAVFGEGKTAIKMARVLHEGLRDILSEGED